MNRGDADHRIRGLRREHERGGGNDTLHGGRGIDSNDGISLLVFVKNKHVVRSLPFPRNRGDWAMIENHAGFTPAQAVFKVTAEEAQPAWWVVSETRPSR